MPPKCPYSTYKLPSPGINISLNYLSTHSPTFIPQIHSTPITQPQLPFHFFTPHDPRDIIPYNSARRITVQITCDY
ncbi:anti-sigma-F factor Fin, partial [Paenibacillus xylanexedens]|uniref:anti-sigma-F factor Fin n=1 Tax=Paenibacillus xylanexedens TaxID=528191 RepID=UPI0028CB5ED3